MRVAESSVVAQSVIKSEHTRSFMQEGKQRLQKNTKFQTFGINKKFLSGHKEDLKKKKEYKLIESQSVGAVGQFKENLDLNI